MALTHVKKGRRSGRKEHRNQQPKFQASRLQDSAEGFEAQQGLSDSDPEPESIKHYSSEDDVIPEKQNAYSALLQVYGQALQKEEPRRKRRKLLEKDKGLVGRASIEGNSRLEHRDEQETQPTDQEEEEDLEENDNGEDSECNDEVRLDPFDIHFASPDETDLASALKKVQQKSWSSITIPQGDGDAGKWTMLDIGIQEKLNTPFQSLDSFKYKARLQREMLTGISGSTRNYAAATFAYRDVLYGDRTVAGSEALRSITCFHALNHVFKTRDRVVKNNEKLAKAGPDSMLEFRDQGFTRPKVLVLLPTRQSCVRYMDTIVDICRPEQQQNKKRFEESFDAEDDLSVHRPADFRELFSGNNDDMFRIGVKFTRKTIKYFTAFYASDIILASPLGLRQAISGKKTDADFLSSIEMLVIDQADALIMQNWDHVTHIFEHMNLQPKEAHGCDFSRVRPWYLDGNAKYLRQTLILSSFITPQILALLSKHASNMAGRAIYTTTYAGAILQPQAVGTKQVFLRFTSPTIAADPTARFNHFISAILPSIIKAPRRHDGSGLGLLIYIPSSLDYPRIRNHFSFHPSCANISFGSIDENHEPANRDVRRARSHFEAGRHSVLLYTERAHHFYRYKLKRVKNVLFYGAPTNPIFYEEVLAFMDNQDDKGTRCLFSKWEALALERVVGSDRVAKMIREKAGDVFEFL